MDDPMSSIGSAILICSIRIGNEDVLMRGATVNDKAPRQAAGHRCRVAALPLFDKSAWAGQFSISKSVDATIDTSAYMANSSAPYGRAMNGNSFETDTLTTFNGYQYTAYWKTVVTGGVTSGDLASARGRSEAPRGRPSR